METGHPRKKNGKIRTKILIKTVLKKPRDDQKGSTQKREGKGRETQVKRAEEKDLKEKGLKKKGKKKKGACLRPCKR